jgi:predicted Rossmann fold flavoprotein
LKNDALKNTPDVIIIGGGAAGLFCAIQAGKRRRKVLVIEHNSNIGKKILISGGGRCNFTNLFTTDKNFLSANPHFCKSALARFTPQDFIDLVEKHRIAYHEKKLGQLFCDGSSQLIIEMLLAECRAAGVEIRTGCRVGKVEKRANSFKIETNQGSFECESLVVATGGLSIRDRFWLRSRAAVRASHSNYSAGAGALYLRTAKTRSHEGAQRRFN